MASGRVIQLLLRSRVLGNGARGHARSFVRDGDVQLHSTRTLGVGQTPWSPTTWRAFASSSATDGQMSVEEPEAKEIPGTWVVKGLVLAMLTYIGMNVAPMMGDSMVRQSVALVKVKDPYFKRTGASRLSLIATDDAKRKRIVDAGGVAALVGMLETAPDDETRREAVKALARLSPYAHGYMRMLADQARGQCYSVLSIVCAEICTKYLSEKTLETYVYGPFTLTDAAVEAMHEVGGHPLLHTLSESTTDSDTQEHTSVLLQRMDHWKVTKSK